MWLARILLRVRKIPNTHTPFLNTGIPDLWPGSWRLCWGWPLTDTRCSVSEGFIFMIWKILMKTSTKYQIDFFKLAIFVWKEWEKGSKCWGAVGKAQKEGSKCDKPNLLWFIIIINLLQSMTCFDLDSYNEQGVGFHHLRDSFQLCDSMINDTPWKNTLTWLLLSVTKS